MREKRSNEGFKPSTQSPASKQRKTEYMKDIKEFMRQKRSEERLSLQS